MFHNPATGRYFQASPALYLLVAALDGRTTTTTALEPVQAADRTGLLEGLVGMIASGLLLVPGAKPPRRKGNAALSALGGVAFTRVRLGDMGVAMPLLRPLLGWLYTRGGAVVLALLIAAAAFAWAGRGAELREHAARFANLGIGDLAIGYVVFFAAKLLHEAGHAVAVDRMAAAEGISVASHPWGMSFMFLLPAPYVDASSAWFLHSPARRATVGLAGVATDLLVAALAALLWAELGPGLLRDRLFDLVVICSVSSLLFNLNPLVKLDGYYVLSDLAGIPNLMARAHAALGRLVFGPFGLVEAPGGGDVPLGLYAAASWIYRWTIYLSIFWLAGGMHWLLAGGVATVVATLFLALPLLRLARSAQGAFGRAPGRATVFVAIVAALAAAVILLPLPNHVVVEGVVVRPGLSFVFARTDGLLLDVAPAGPLGDRTVLRLDNPETDRLLLQLRAEAQSIAIDARRARAAGAERIDAALERQRAVGNQIAALEAERATWQVRASPGATWEPLRAEALAGAWVRRDDARPLGALLTEGPAEIRLVLDQWDGPAALAALAAAQAPRIPLRLRGASEAATEGRPAWPAVEARDSLPSPALATAAGGRIAARLDNQGTARPTERVFELRVLADPAGTAAWQHGARVEARIALPPASLLDQLWWRLRQALQRRLAV